MVRKRDGDPTYQLASVADDLQWGIDLVVRGEDLLDSSLFQHYLAVQLVPGGFREVSFLHHPLISGVEGKKLSKSAGDAAVSDLRRAGAGRREVFGGISGMLGISEAPDCWEDLFTLIAGRFRIDDSLVQP